MAKAILHLEAKGRRDAILTEARQVLATARLAVETVITDYGDDGGDLERTAETLRRWEGAARQPTLPGMEA